MICIRKACIIWLAVVFALVLCSGFAFAQQPVALTYAYWGLPSVEQRVVDLFESEHPHIHIEVFQITGGTHGSAEKLLVMAASESLPDMFSLSGTQGYPATFMDAGFLLDLTPYMERDRIRPDLFVPNAWNYAMRDGRVYGWPRATYGISLGTGVIAYNREMYRNAGLDYPQPGWTFDDFLSNARRLTIRPSGDGMPTQWGFNRPNYSWWQIWVWSNGGEIFTDDLKEIRLLETPAIEALQWLADLMTVHQVAPTSVQAFERQLSAMSHVSTSVYRDYTSYTDLDYSLIGPPRGPRGDSGYSLGGSNIIGVSAFTKHPEEVWMFLKFLADRRVHELEVFEWRTATPNLRSVALSPRFLYSDTPPYDLSPIVYHNPAKPTPQDPKWPAFHALVQEIFAEVRTGRASAQAAFEAAEPRLKAAWGLE
ncbi:MAG: sugar ABC transporter substrate-binding protein [Firmicutes bacterium]|nr:sugar ABC transporter substrate-binding protein [Bacillota bacterium]